MQPFKGRYRREKIKVIAGEVVMLSVFIALFLGYNAYQPGV